MAMPSIHLGSEGNEENKKGSGTRQAAASPATEAACVEEIVATLPKTANDE